MAKKLYPPIVEPTIPPFFGDSITVPFILNRAVGITEINGMSLIIKSMVTNEPIIEAETTSFSNNEVTFYISNQANVLFAGGSYKVQIAFRQKIDDKFITGFYSAVTVAKYLGTTAPILDIKDEIAKNNMFIGTYELKEDITEKLKSYSFTLYDNNDQIVDQSGELLHNSTADMGTLYQDFWTPIIALTSGYNYKLTYSITTINGYKNSETRIITAKKDDSGYIPQNIALSATMDEENGYVNITIKSTTSVSTKTLVYGKFRIYRVCSKDGYKERTRIAYFSLENQDIFEKSFKDFTAESGYRYKYVLQQINDWGIHSEEIWSSGEGVKVNYEHLFLFDGERQLKIKYNPKVSSFKNTIYEAKVDTLGGKYPFIFRNNNTLYKELSISGLISYKMDEQNLFLKDSDIWPELDVGLSGKERWTHNLTYDNITAERTFKLKVLDWLNNGQIKLFKSPTEGNYIVRLLNVSLTPTDAVGRMLHTFTATGYEVDDVNKYQFTQSIIVDKTNRYIGYKTTPLYDFPKSRLLINKDRVEIQNNKYEIILNPSLEFVTGVRFEDIKPLTKFKIILERKGVICSFQITIGATGFYAIPTELGYHIKSIRLVADKWEIDDYDWDIINNRGQVTYEFERQAKHNNFNDITEISSDIVISAPLNADIITAEIQEPLITADEDNNTSLYEYDAVASEEALVEIAYFKDRNEPYLRGVDYKVITAQNNDIIYLECSEDIEVEERDDKRYYQKETNNEITVLQLAENMGYEHSIGDAIYMYKPAVDPRTEINQTYLINSDHPLYCFTPEGKVYEDFKNKTSKSAILFLPLYDSKGVQRIKKIITERKDCYQNPYYVFCAKTNELIKRDGKQLSVFSEPIYADIYKTVPVISIGEEKSSLDKQTIYRNHVTNKYYNATNVDGEYYIKEEIQNIYNLDFELVQVFYEQSLLAKDNDGCGDRNYTGNIFYEQIEENNGYNNIRRINVDDKTYVESSYPDSEVGALAEVYYDYVQVYGTGKVNQDIFIENPYILAKSILPTELLSIYAPVYNLTDITTIPESVDLYFYNHFNKFNFYKKEDLEKLAGVCKYTKVTVPEEVFKIEEIKKDGKTIKQIIFTNNIPILNDNIYINPLIKGYDNYIEQTTPKTNEVVIVYSDHPNHIEKIDLSDRFSYHISAEELGQEDLKNIAAVYIGKNVRGFMTYKRKLYSYNAVLDDGLVIELTPYTQIKQEVSV